VKNSAINIPLDQIDAFCPRSQAVLGNALTGQAQLGKSLSFPSATWERVNDKVKMALSKEKS